MSTSSRDRIFKAIRSAQADRPDAGGDVTGRLQSHQRGPLPAIGEELETLLRDQLETAASTTARVSNATQLGEEVAQWLQEQGAGMTVIRSSSSLLEQLTWPALLDVRDSVDGMAEGAVVTEAFCAIAETGSLVMLSSAESPTTLNFLPDDFICVVRCERIVSHIEDVWDLVREEIGGMPRALNIITGPSRTADVEQTIQLGAHGPRRMHVILYDDQIQ